MDSFDNLLKAACHIKSYHLNQDKKMFEKLPEFFKVGLYCSDMFKNVRKQDFFAKSAAYEVQKQIGLDFIKEKDWEEAEYCFCKCLSIFKYIKTRVKNWKTEGIKDEDLEYFEDRGNNEEEKLCIDRLIISSLLNISLCNLEMKKFEECREACNEVLLRDPNNIKAYYRRSRTYLEYKASTLEDHILALKDLESILKIDPNNSQIKKNYEELSAFIETEKKDEKMVFKSFFRKINETGPYKDPIENKKEIEKSDTNKIPKNIQSNPNNEDNNIGKAEIRILNLLIEQCYSLRDRYERVNNKIEVKRMTAIAEKAHEYRSELQKLLDLNFDNPNEELKEFAKKNNMDLKDGKVQKYFLDIRKKYLEDINKFYEKNFLNFNNQIPQNTTNNTLNSNIKKSVVSNENVKNPNKVTMKSSNIQQGTQNKANIINPIKSNKESKIDKKPSTEREFLKKKIYEGNPLIETFKKNVSPPIFFGVLFVALVLYFFKNHNENK